MKEKAYESNRLIFNFFSDVDYKVAKGDYEKYISNIKPSKGNIFITAYFNDDEDMYKVNIIGGYGDESNMDVYSWDELSTIIHDNL